MKEPPTSQIGRSVPTNFVSQGQQQGAVMMVYGLDNDTSNTDKLFNLVCLYGNVARVNTFFISCPSTAFNVFYCPLPALSSFTVLYHPLPDDIFQV